MLSMHSGSEKVENKKIIDFRATSVETATFDTSQDFQHKVSGVGPLGFEIF